MLPTFIPTGELVSKGFKNVSVESLANQMIPSLSKDHEKAKQFITKMGKSFISSFDFLHNYWSLFIETKLNRFKNSDKELIFGRIHEDFYEKWIQPLLLVKRYVYQNGVEKIDQYVQSNYNLILKLQVDELEVNLKVRVDGLEKFCTIFKLPYGNISNINNTKCLILSMLKPESSISNELQEEINEILGKIQESKIPKVKQRYIDELDQKRRMVQGDKELLLEKYKTICHRITQTELEIIIFHGILYITRFCHNIGDLMLLLQILTDLFTSLPFKNCFWLSNILSFLGNYHTYYYSNYDQCTEYIIEFLKYSTKFCPIRTASESGCSICEAFDKKFGQ
jgi:hypothetical protein